MVESCVKNNNECIKEMISTVRDIDGTTSNKTFEDLIYGTILIITHIAYNIRYLICTRLSLRKSSLL